MNHQRIDNNDMSGIVEGSSGAPDERFGMVHDGGRITELVERDTFERAPQYNAQMPMLSRC